MTFPRRLLQMPMGLLPTPRPTVSTPPPSGLTWRTAAALPEVHEERVRPEAATCPATSSTSQTTTAWKAKEAVSDHAPPESCQENTRSPRHPSPTLITHCQCPPAHTCPCWQQWVLLRHTTSQQGVRRGFLQWWVHWQSADNLLPPPACWAFCAPSHLCVALYVSCMCMCPVCAGPGWGCRCGASCLRRPTWCWGWGTQSWARRVLCP